MYIYIYIKALISVAIAAVRGAGDDRERLQPALVSSALIPLVCYAESQLWLQQRTGSADIDIGGLDFCINLTQYISVQLSLNQIWDAYWSNLAYRSGA